MSRLLSFQNLTPLIFSFELPIMSSSQALPDSTTPYLVKIQEKYNVQVMFRTRPKLHATLVVVKGCEWEVSQVKEATVLLIHYMCQNLAVSNVRRHIFLIPIFESDENTFSQISNLLSLSLSLLPTIESNTSTNIDGDFTSTSQHRVGETEQ